MLQKGAKSSQYAVRLGSMLGAYLTQDAKAVPILLKMLQDSNAILRSVAARLACDFRDAPLKKEISKLFETEKNQNVRIEVIDAIGKLEMKQQRKKLLSLISDKKTCFQEKLC